MSVYDDGTDLGPDSETPDSETPAVTVQAGLATATSSVPGPGEDED
jgi:hypothetical protein